jgi:hypothetical protein
MLAGLWGRRLQSINGETDVDHPGISKYPRYERDYADIESQP